MKNFRIEKDTLGVVKFPKTNIGVHKLKEVLKILI